jgi:Cellulase (glycosyl hydrolase family 5)
LAFRQLAFKKTSLVFSKCRYARRKALLAIELINEPLAPKATLDSLKKYYQAGYDAVRKHTSAAYVIMSNRLSAESTELLQFASGFQKSVLDVHYYNLFTSEFTSMTVQQNIDYVNNQRSTDLSTVSIANGPLVLVGKS